MKKIILNTFFALLLVISCNLRAYAMEFSADMFNNGKPGGKIFIKGIKTRVNPPGNAQYMIGRQDKNIIYIVMPAQRMYMEQKFDPRTIPTANIDPTRPNYKKEFIATENVNGKTAKKYKVTVDNNVSYQWYVGGILVPVKIHDLASGSIVEYRNISMSVQDSVFELPPGYQKMVMPGTGTPQMPDMNQMKKIRNLYN